MDGKTIPSNENRSNRWKGLTTFSTKSKAEVE